MPHSWHGVGSKDGHTFEGTWTMHETGIDFDGYFTCGPHDDEGNHLSPQPSDPS